MKIELKQPYKSITTLTATGLPDFTVLIGRNGAGKTQLLDALREGPAVIPGHRRGGNRNVRHTFLPPTQRR